MDVTEDDSSSNVRLEIVEDHRQDDATRPTFVVGREFDSFNELSSAVKEYEYANSVTLYTRSSRSIEAAKKRAPKRHFSEGLVYSELDYACVHGGRHYKSHSKGVRKSQRLVLLAHACMTYILDYMLQYVSKGMSIYD